MACWYMAKGSSVPYRNGFAFVIRQKLILPLNVHIHHGAYHLAEARAEAELSQDTCTAEFTDTSRLRVRELQCRL